MPDIESFDAVIIGTGQGGKPLAGTLAEAGWRTAIFINAGARPRVPSIPGLGDVPWLDSTSIMELDRAPEHLLVLGAGFVGLEFGQMFRRFGSEVTIVEHGSRIAGREDEDVSEETLHVDGGLTLYPDFRTTWSSE